MEDKEIKSIIESVLFMSGGPVTLDELRKVIEVDKYNTERLVKELITEYSLRAGGLLIVEVAGGVQMATNPVCAPWLRKVLSDAVPKKLSQSSIETMAIIAYKQPVIKAEIEAIRGVNSDGVIKTLLDRRLIKIIGRKEVPGRPLMYCTTNEFLQYFGLKELSELPTLKEFEEVDIPETPEHASVEVVEQAAAEAAHEDSYNEQDETIYIGGEEEVGALQPAGEDIMPHEEETRPSE